MKLPRSFYLRNDVVKIARELIGKYLYTNIDGIFTGGIITETEAYNAKSTKPHMHSEEEERPEPKSCMQKAELHMFIYVMEFTLCLTL